MRKLLIMCLIISTEAFADDAKLIQDLSIFIEDCSSVTIEHVWGKSFDGEVNVWDNFYASCDGEYFFRHAEKSLEKTNGTVVERLNIFTNEELLVLFRNALEKTKLKIQNDRCLYNNNSFQVSASGALLDNRLHSSKIFEVYSKK